MRRPLDPDVLDMLRQSLRHVLAEDTQRPLSNRLGELGWDDVVADDAPTALRTLFEIKGETVAPADALGPALARHLADLLGDGSLATATVTLVSPFGPTTARSGAIHLDAVALSAPSTAPAAGRLVFTMDGRLGTCGSADLTLQPLGETDDSPGPVRVTGSVAEHEVAWLDAGPGTDLDAQVTARGRWLIACELVGIGRHVVAAAVEYCKERVQYGRPIGAFQALQHRLASAHAMVVGASHLATEAGESGDPWTALVAKCMAGQTAEYACTQAQQCYGAIGFTWEHEFHRYLRRTYALDGLFGNWRTLEHEIGVTLQATNVVPRIGTL